MNIVPSEKPEYATRHENAQQLINDFDLESDAEFFANPDHRLEFLQGLNYEDFLSLARHVNGRMRDMNPREKQNHNDVGAQLMLLATPPSQEKPEAFAKGFEEISTYLQESSDRSEEKLKAVEMATEALIIWVHPFNDGNGRTSRFFGKFIEDGTADVAALSDESSSINSRLRIYGDGLRVDEWNMVKDLDVMLDDDELEEIRNRSEMPVIDGIRLSIRRLLEDKQLQGHVERNAQGRVARYQAMLAQRDLQNKDAA